MVANKSFTPELCKSAIALPLQMVATQQLADLAVGHGGDVSAPISEALGFRYRRYRRQANQTQTSLIFTNEDGTVWQGKILEHGRTDGRTGQYLAPRGNGDRIYTPSLDPETREKVGARYGVSVPATGSFWDWVRSDTSIPLVTTEGGKKSLCGLSHGYVATSLYGCSSGVLKDTSGRYDLKDDLKQFAQPGRKIYLALDKDTKEKGRKAVLAGIHRLSQAFSRYECRVFVVDWNSKDGKGMDDLIANCGIEAFDRAIKEAKPYEIWKHTKLIQQRLAGHKADYIVNTNDLSRDLDFSRIPSEGIVVLDSAKGTGKTKAIGKMVQSSSGLVALGSRVTLQRNLAARLSCAYLADADKYQNGFIAGGEKTNRISLCVDSVMSIAPDFTKNKIVGIDEVDQFIEHLLTGLTCGKKGKRPALITRTIAILRNAKQVICASADVTSWQINLIAELSGKPVYLISNHFTPPPYECDYYISGDDSAGVRRLIEDVKQGKTLFAGFDTKSQAQKVARVLAEFATGEIIEVNSDTTGTPEIKALLENPDQELERRKPQIVITTTSMTSGVSFESDYFARVYVFAYGNSIGDSGISQLLKRVRQPVPRVVWVAKSGRNYSYFGRSQSKMKIGANMQKTAAATKCVLKDVLTPNQLAHIDSIDWSNSINQAVATIESDRNRSMSDLRNCVQARLEHEGNRVNIITSDGDKEVRALLRTAAKEVKVQNAQLTANARNISGYEAGEYEAKTERLDPKQKKELEKYHLANWYVLKDVTTDDVLADNQGRWRRGLGRLERLIFPALATEKDVKTIDDLCQWNSELTPIDLPTNTLKCESAKLLGIDKLLAYAAEGMEWDENNTVVQEVCNQVRHYKDDVKLFLGFTVTDKMTNNQIVGEILSRYGLKTQSRKCQGKRIYSLNLDSLTKVREILSRRHQKRVEKGTQLQATPLYKLFVLGGVPIAETDKTSPSKMEIPPDNWLDDDEIF